MSVVVTVVIVGLLALSSVVCYTDLRNSPCMHPSLATLLPPRRSLWSGTIRLTLTCDPGYDLALNTPPRGRMECKPDGSPWVPDYIADCNPLMRPDDILINMTLRRGDLCSTLGGGDIEHNGNVIKFPAGKSIDTIAACRNTKVIKSCSLVEAAMTCNDNKTNLNVIVSVNYTEELNQALVKDDRLVQLLADQFELTSGPPAVYSIHSEGCRAGTLGTFDVKLGAVCRGCSLGHYLSALTNSCQPCPPGHYADSPLSVKCKICPTLAKDANATVWAEVNRTSVWRSYGIFMCPRPGLSTSPRTTYHPLKEDQSPLKSTNSGPAIPLIGASRLGAVVWFFTLVVMLYQRETIRK